MSLYHEAAGILETAQKDGGSFKSLIFTKKTWKSDPKTLFALTTEAAKWSEVIAEVVEKSGILKLEKNLSPTLALLLTHDLFLSKRGVALPSSHGLNATITRHKVRLSAELTKARLRRGFPTLDALREHINSESTNGPEPGSNGLQRTRHPRWIRINTIRTSSDTELKGTFAAYSQTWSLLDVRHAAGKDRILYVDEHIPNLVAIAGPDDPTSFKAYKEGRLILQEKASCFPAYLLDPKPNEGDVIDTCAAPGNKTTHLAALLSGSESRVTACERDVERSKTLTKMVKLAGADLTVKILPKQDFLKLDPEAKSAAKVTSLLLDPSCSGSGIVGRDETSITVRLPSANAEDTTTSRSKKRKRGLQKPQQPSSHIKEQEDIVVEETEDQNTEDAVKLKARLENLSAFQLRLLQHAMSFPAARRITYSTCSLHAEENEHVVSNALLSDIALDRGWRVLKRDEQVDGMQRWHRRGLPDAVEEAFTPHEGKLKARFDANEIAEACIRCQKGGDDGTMGFFVAGFVRDEWPTTTATNGTARMEDTDDEMSDGEEWEGFSDEG